MPLHTHIYAQNGIVTYYNAFIHDSSLDTRRLLTFMPIPQRVRAAGGNKISAFQDPINLTLFLRRGATHSTLIDLREFVHETFCDDVLTPDAHSVAIEGKLVSILGRWAKAYIAAHIMSGSMLNLDDLDSILEPFVNSPEVTIALAIGSQFNLNDPSITPEHIKLGWRKGEPIY